jgi:hypothetical protein
MTSRSALTDRRERHVVAPALSVRLTNSGPVASSINVRPGPTVAIVDAGDGVFLAADPDYPPDQLYVPLDLLRLRFLHAMARQMPCAPDDLIDELVGTGPQAEADRHDLEHLVDQLWAGGLLAVADGETWTRPPSHRTRRVPCLRDLPDIVADTLDLQPGRRMRRTNPCALLVTRSGFERLDPDGETLDVLSDVDVLILDAAHPGHDAQGVYEEVARDPHAQVSEQLVNERLHALARSGLVVNTDPDLLEKVGAELRQKERAYKDAEDGLREVLAQERRRSEETGVRRPVVVAIDADTNPLLALGTVVAYARAYEGGHLTESYAFAPILYTNQIRLANLVDDLAEWPVVLLFSDYLWTREANLAMGAMIRARAPGALTIHGGPEMPKYAEDAEQFFADYPFVDCGVRGEGEATLAALLDALVPSIPDWSERGQVPDLTVLAEVEGVTYRGPEGVVLTPDRDRIVDLETIPSPYLTGLFEDVGRRDSNTIVIESNRGCPYGCTFCDWGSATLSRIRKFSLERVKAEMEWAASHGIVNFGLTDANFGILERDVEIAEWAVELKARYGVPETFQVTYAKSRVQNLTRIVRILAEAEILTQAAVSVQTMDKEVLLTIKRKNLDLNQHVPLVVEFEDLGLPIYSDLMLGLPGSTVATVQADLQFCIDREIHYRPNPTQLLVNSPMNEEPYRVAQGIVAKPGEYLLETRTYTKADMRLMADIAEYALMADRRGTLRELATYVRSELRIPETDFYRLLIEAGTDSRRWPFLGYLNSVVTRRFVPPGSWAAVIESVGDFMVELGVPDDDALATVLAVQLALIPMAGRSFPETVRMPHDYVAWRAELRRAHRDVAEGHWVDVIEPLRSFGPGELVIRDANNTSARVLGVRPRGFWDEIVWELDTPIARGAQRVKRPA